MTNPKKTTTSLTKKDATPKIKWAKVSWLAKTKHNKLFLRPPHKCFFRYYSSERLARDGLRHWAIQKGFVNIEEFINNNCSIEPVAIPFKEYDATCKSVRDWARAMASKLQEDNRKHSGSYKEIEQQQKACPVCQVVKELKRVAEQVGGVTRKNE